MTSSQPTGYGQNARCVYHIDALGHDTNNCWVSGIKSKSLVDNGMIAIAPLVAQKHRYQPLAFSCGRTLRSLRQHDLN